MKKNMGGKTKKTRKNLKKVGGAGILNSIFSIIFVMCVIGALMKQQEKKEVIEKMTDQIRALERGDIEEIKTFFNHIPSELPPGWETKLRYATDVRRALKKSLGNAQHWTGHSAEISAALPSEGLIKAKELIKEIAFRLEHKDKPGESVVSREFNKERLDYIEEGLDNLSGKTKRSQSAPSGTRRSRSSASKSGKTERSQSAPEMKRPGNVVGQAYMMAEIGAIPKEYSLVHRAMRGKTYGVRK